MCPRPKQPLSINGDVPDDVDDPDMVTPSGPTPPPNPIHSAPATTRAANNHAAKHSDPETTLNSRPHREKPRRASSVAGSDVASNPRDTFLGYFFGGQPGGGTTTPNGINSINGVNGVGGSKIVGATTAALLGPRHERTIGRDTMSESGAPPSALESRGRSLDSPNAAYDMKSLGRHIEAVSILVHGFHRHFRLLNMTSSRRSQLRVVLRRRSATSGKPLSSANSSLRTLESYAKPSRTSCPRRSCIFL